MQNNAIRFACNGCGVCCKGRLIPLTLNETRQWLGRGHEVAVILEAFNESNWVSQPQQYAHSARRAVEVGSGEARIRVVAVLAANATAVGWAAATSSAKLGPERAPWITVLPSTSATT